MNQNEQWEEEKEGDDELEEYWFPTDYQLRKEAVWTRVPLKNHKGSLRASRVLCFDHYLVIKLDECLEDHDEESESAAKSAAAFFLAVDMRDQSVQEVRISQESWYYSNLWNYSFTKYKENQMIEFGSIDGNGKFAMSLITIESFEPFQIKCKDIVVDDVLDFGKHTAQIHNDFLYAFGPKRNCYGESYLWRFDIQNRKWEELETNTENISERLNEIRVPVSFIFEDNLYIYGEVESCGVFFCLNLKTMTWSEMEDYVDREDMDGYSIAQNTYKDHAIFLNEYTPYVRNEVEDPRSVYDIVSLGYCKIAPTDLSESIRGRRIKIIPSEYRGIYVAAVYNNYLVTFGGRWAEKKDDFSMFLMNLDYLYGFIEESEEEEHFKSLFMNEEKADVTFKVQDKQFPAHKEVLIKKSKHFAQLLKNTAETMIEIQDCDEATFKEFLNYLYDEQVHLKEGLKKDLTMKLIIFADKYKQYDLRDKCAELLRFNLNSNNVLKALELACQLRLPRLKEACINFLKTKIDLDNIARIIEFLESQDFFEIKSKAISFVLENFEKISAENLGLCESFLVKNFGIDTIALFAKAAYSDEKPNNYGGKWVSEVSKDGTTDLRLVILNFGTANLQEIGNKGMFQDLPKKFLADIALSVISNKEKEVSN